MGYSGFLTTKNTTGGTISAQDLDDRYLNLGIATTLPQIRNTYFTYTYLGDTYNWTCPANITKILVYACGGGGGGNSTLYDSGPLARGEAGGSTSFKYGASVLLTTFGGNPGAPSPYLAYGGANLSTGGIWGNGGDSSGLGTLLGEPTRFLNGQDTVVNDPFLGYFVGLGGLGGRVTVDDQGGGGGGGAGMPNSQGGAGGNSDTAGGNGLHGAGGGGGGAGGSGVRYGGGGGASGITVRQFIDVTPGYIYTVLLGNGGAGGAGGFTGGYGGSGVLYILY